MCIAHCCNTLLMRLLYLNQWVGKRYVKMHYGDPGTTSVHKGDQSQTREHNDDFQRIIGVVSTILRVICREHQQHEICIPYAGYNCMFCN